MSYQVIIPKQVRKQLDALPQSVRNRINEQLSKLEQDPYLHGSQKMRGSSNEYRIRVGDYRVIYRIRNQELIVTIIKVQHRKDVYRD